MEQNWLKGPMPMGLGMALVENPTALEKYAAMTREDKLRVIDNLERHGAFLIKKSGQRICQALSISKFTLYNYLEMIHKDAGGPPAEAEETP